MKHIARHMTSKGFALPTVMIASVVMLMVLMSGLVAATSVNTALRTQGEDRTLRLAAEAGIAYAKACLKKSGNVVTWTNPLGPNTDCTGAAQGAACDFTASLQPQCGVLETQTMRSSFVVPVPTTNNGQQMIQSTGVLNKLKGSTRLVASSRTLTRSLYLGGGVQF